jgi:hypothetical protein
MNRAWVEVGDGSGIWRHDAVHKGFGPVSTLAIELGGERYAVISAPKTFSADVASGLQETGEVVALIAPNIAHTSGLARWSELWPAAGLYGPDDRLSELARLTGREFQPVSTLQAESGLTFFSAPGTRSGAVWVKSERSRAPTVYLDEVLTTLKTRPSSMLSAALYWLTGTHPGWSVNHLFMRVLCSDPAQHAAAAMAFSDGAGAIIPAHGDAVVGLDEAAQLRALLSPYAKGRTA